MRRADNSADDIVMQTYILQMIEGERRAGTACVLDWLRRKRLIKPMNKTTSSSSSSAASASAAQQ